MLAQSITHELLSSDRYYVPNQEPVAGVGFPYQAFSDDRIVRAVLHQHRDEARLLTDTGSLPVVSPLRRWLASASPNLQEAASILLPQLTGTELVDVLHGPDQDAETPDSPDSSRRLARRHRLIRALLVTLPLREASTITPRTVELVDQAASQQAMKGMVLDAVLAVATEPGHPLNADRLHDQLIALPRARRDAWWGPRIYGTLSEAGPLHRLLRWAEQLPTPRRLQPDHGEHQPRSAAATCWCSATRPARAGRAASGGGPPGLHHARLDPELV